MPFGINTSVTCEHSDFALTMLSECDKILDDSGCSHSHWVVILQIQYALISRIPTVKTGLIFPFFFNFVPTTGGLQGPNEHRRGSHVAHWVRGCHVRAWGAPWRRVPPAPVALRTGVPKCRRRASAGTLEKFGIFTVGHHALARCTILARKVA